jgi:hypothetical protein
MALTKYNSFKAQSWYVVPIFISGLILICLNIYEVVYGKKNKDIIYAELVLSFIASSAVLIYMIPIFIFVCVQIFMSPFKNIPFTLYVICMILFSPFVFTVIKAFTQNKEYHKYISAGTILTTISSMIFTFNFAFNAR